MKIIVKYERQKYGPLIPYAEEFRKYLLNLNYRKNSAQALVLVFQHFSKWLDICSIEIINLNIKHIDLFLVHRKQLKYKHWISKKGIQSIIQFLLKAKILKTQKIYILKEDSLEKVISDFKRYLIFERQMSEQSIYSYCNVSRRFLLFTLGKSLNYKNINAKSIRDFILSEKSKYTASSTRCSITAIRSFLRWLYIQEEISTPFHTAVPAVAVWKTNIPQSVNTKDVELLLNNCDCRTHRGRRSYAIILLMSRLGLRRIEVSRLSLDCINWFSGEFKVHSKGTESILPLSEEIGLALSSYIQRSRPKAKYRNVFLSLQAPYKPIGGHSIASDLQRACLRAKIKHISSHQLRHTVASEMLRKGSSLAEIGQVLRHESIDTTSIYAKIDDLSLESVVQEWAGGVL